MKSGEGSLGSLLVAEKLLSKSLSSSQINWLHTLETDVEMGFPDLHSKIIEKLVSKMYRANILFEKPLISLDIIVSNPRVTYDNPILVQITAVGGDSSIYLSQSRYKVPVQILAFEPTRITNIYLITRWTFIPCVSNPKFSYFEVEDADLIKLLSITVPKPPSLNITPLGDIQSSRVNVSGRIISISSLFHSNSVLTFLVRISDGHIEKLVAFQTFLYLKVFLKPGNSYTFSGVIPSKMGETMILLIGQYSHVYHNDTPRILARIQSLINYEGVITSFRNSSIVLDDLYDLRISHHLLLNYGRGLRVGTTIRIVNVHLMEENGKIIGFAMCLSSNIEIINFSPIRSEFEPILYDSQSDPFSIVDYEFYIETCKYFKQMFNFEGDQVVPIMKTLCTSIFLNRSVKTEFLDHSCCKILSTSDSKPFKPLSHVFKHLHRRNYVLHSDIPFHLIGTLRIHSTGQMMITDKSKSYPLILGNKNGTFGELSDRWSSETSLLVKIANFQVVLLSGQYFIEVDVLDIKYLNKARSNGLSSKLLIRNHLSPQIVVSSVSKRDSNSFLLTGTKFERILVTNPLSSSILPLLVGGMILQFQNLVLVENQLSTNDWTAIWPISSENTQKTVVSIQHVLSSTDYRFTVRAIILEKEIRDDDSVAYVISDINTPHQIKIFYNDFGEYSIGSIVRFSNVVKKTSQTGNLYLSLQDSVVSIEQFPCNLYSKRQIIERSCLNLENFEGNILESNETYFRLRGNMISVNSVFVRKVCAKCLESLCLCRNSTKIFTVKCDAILDCGKFNYLVVIREWDVFVTLFQITSMDIKEFETTNTFKKADQEPTFLKSIIQRNHVYLYKDLFVRKMDQLNLIHTSPLDYRHEAKKLIKTREFGKSMNKSN